MVIRPSPPSSPEELRELINKYRSKQTFLTRVKFHNPNDAEGVRLVVKAYEYNSELFRGKRRKSGGSYMNGHLVPTAILAMEYWGITNPVYLAALLSHDSIEDFKHITRKILSIILHPQVGYIACGLTKPPLNGLDPNSHEFAVAVFSKVEHYGIVCLVLKILCDRLHNMLTLWGTPKKKLAKIRETKNYVLPLARKYGLPTDELEDAIREQCIRLHLDDTAL